MLIYEALEIAMEVLEEQDLKYRPDFKLHASRVEDEWVFWFVFLPEAHGLDVTVFVADDGRTRVLPGI